MKAFGIDELKSHDVFEFCYANKFPHYWNEDSLYVEFDEFIGLYPYLEKIVPNYKCYAPQKVSREQWRKIKSLLVDKEKYASFFVFLSMKIVTFSPKRSSHTFLPRGKSIVERMRSYGIVPEQDIVVNVSE